MLLSSCPHRFDFDLRLCNVPDTLVYVVISHDVLGVQQLPDCVEISHRESNSSGRVEGRENMQQYPTSNLSVALVM